MYGCLGKHGIILNLRLPDRRAVVADQYQLGCATHKVSANNRHALDTSWLDISRIPFPDRRVFRHVLEPRVNLPLFMTSAKRAFMLSWLFFCMRQQMFVCTTTPKAVWSLRWKPFCSCTATYRLLCCLWCHCSVFVNLLLSRHQQQRRPSWATNLQTQCQSIGTRAPCAGQHRLRATLLRRMNCSAVRRSRGHTGHTLTQTIKLLYVTTLCRLQRVKQRINDK